MSQETIGPGYFFYYKDMEGYSHLSCIVDSVPITKDPKHSHIRVWTILIVSLDRRSKGLYKQWETFNIFSDSVIANEIRKKTASDT